MDPSWLGTMRRLIGMSRNHLAWILDASPQLIARWETGDNRGMSPDVIDAVENLKLDLDAATAWLESEGIGWDDLITFRQAGMKLGISIGTLHATLKRKDIDPIDLGLLGLWITHEDLAACRQ